MICIILISQDLKIQYLMFFHSLAETIITETPVVTSTTGFTIKHNIANETKEGERTDERDALYCMEPSKIPTCLYIYISKIL